jgi:hypothetical protein
LKASLSQTSPDYTGIYYTELIEKNIKNGGQIINLDIFMEKNRKVVVITTDYADGLTIAKEKLIYKDYMLQTWTIQFNDQQTSHLIFSRREYNKVKRAMISKINKKETLAV